MSDECTDRFTCCHPDNHSRDYLENLQTRWRSPEHTRVVGWTVMLVGDWYDVESHLFISLVSFKYLIQVALDDTDRIWIVKPKKLLNGLVKSHRNVSNPIDCRLVQWVKGQSTGINALQIRSAQRHLKIAEHLMSDEERLKRRRERQVKTAFASSSRSLTSSL